MTIFLVQVCNVIKSITNTPMALVIKYFHTKAYIDWWKLKIWNEPPDKFPWTYNLSYLPICINNNGKGGPSRKALGESELQYSSNWWENYKRHIYWWKLGKSQRQTFKHANRNQPSKGLIDWIKTVQKKTLIENQLLKTQTVKIHSQRLKRLTWNWTNWRSILWCSFRLTCVTQNQ